MCATSIFWRLLILKTGRTVTGVLLAALILCAPLEAQQVANRIEIRGIAGYAGFIDETFLDHFVIGAAARIPLSPTWHVEPEILYMRQSSEHDDFSFLAGVAWTFWRSARAETYLVGAGGILHSRFAFPNAIDPTFSSNEFTGGGGAGIRLRWTDRLAISPEFRFGWEPILRVTFGLGYELDFR